MKLIIRTVFTLLFFVSCNSDEGPQKKIETIEEEDKVEENQGEKVAIVSDLDFSNGIGLAGLSSSDQQVIDTIYPFKKGNSSPTWRLAQWGSRHNLKGVQPEYSSDTIIYQNIAKRLTFLPIQESVQVGLEVFASEEYLSPRQENEDWPHLLLEQQVSHEITLDQMDELNFNIDAKLMYSHLRMDPNLFNPSLHTSQISFYLLVQNRNSESAEYGDFFWFGLPLYDFRYRNIEEYAAADVGKEDASQKFIFSVSTDMLFNGSFQDQNWITISEDIYPYLIHAFQRAQENGYLKGSAIEDMSIASFNFGWEIPGTFDSGIQFKNLELTAVLPE